MRFETADIVDSFKYAPPKAPPLPDFSHGIKPPAEDLAVFIYLVGVVSPGIMTALASCHGIRAPWVPAPFYTDGVLVWFLPVVTVLPILLWPASLVVWGIIATYRRALAADRFCGTSRWRLRGGYRELCERCWWRGGRSRRVDVEQPCEDGGVSATERAAVASSIKDDEAGPESYSVRKPLLGHGDGNMHCGRVPTPPAREEDEELMESDPPAYEP